MKKSILAAACAAITVTATPAMADDRNNNNRPEYDSRGRYIEPQPVGNNDTVWRGKDGRYYCKRNNGTTGLLVGAAGGALLGRTIDTRGERATGTILGAVGGALLGREIERRSARCR